MRALAILLIAALSWSAHASDLTLAQLVTLRADIDANFAEQAAANDLAAIVTAYNAEAVPAYTVWKTSLDPEMYRDAITWTELTARTAGERDMFAFFTGGGTMPISCAKLTARQAIQDTFSGAAGVNTRTALIALCKRTVTRGERLFATGTGTNGTPGLLGAEGPITMDDIIAALGQ